MYNLPNKFRVKEHKAKFGWDTLQTDGLYELE